MKHSKMIVADERKIQRKEVRRAGTLAGIGSFLYTFVIAIVALIGSFFLYGSNNEILHGTEAELTRYVMNHPYTGIISIAGSLIALLVLFLCFAKYGTHKKIFEKNKPMTWKKLGAFLCILYLFSSIGTACYQLIEQDLNLFGLSTSLGLEMVSGKSTTITMFLYAAFIGPVVEELVFRGFLMRRMEKHGKVLAIVLSSVLFGLMHENLPQVLNATMIGLVLGYIAMEYSVGWSILLHVFNNFVMCDLFSRALEGTGDLVIYLAEHSFLWVTGIIAIVILVRNRKAITAWIRNNLCEKRIAVWAMTSVGMIVAVVYHFVNTISNISVG